MRRWSPLECKLSLPDLLQGLHSLLLLLDLLSLRSWTLLLSRCLTGWSFCPTSPGWRCWGCWFMNTWTTLPRFKGSALASLRWIGAEGLREVFRLFDLEFQSDEEEFPLACWYTCTCSRTWICRSSESGMWPLGPGRWTYLHACAQNVSASPAFFGRCWTAQSSSAPKPTAKSNCRSSDSEDQCGHCGRLSEKRNLFQILWKGRGVASRSSTESFFFVAGV